MSKLFKEYENLKKENSEILYLLKSGIFYVSLDDDAKKLSELFNFKITNLNDSVVKCGFPESKLEFYTNLLDKCNVEFKVISSITTSKKVENLSAYLNDEQAKNVLKTIKNIDMNNISFRESFELLEKLHNKIKNLEIG